MKNNTQKWYGLALVVLASSFCFAACKQDEEEDEPTVPETESVYTIQMDKSSLSINRFETGELRAIVHKDGIVMASPTVEWSSANEEILTVEQGVITPVDYGTTTVSASFENQTATCSITIADDGYVPSLLVADEEIRLLMVSDPYQVSASVFYKTVDVDTSSAIITYSVSAEDESVVTVNADGLLTPVSVGEATLTVSAEWKGYDGIGMSKEIPVSVCDDLQTELTGGAEEIYVTDLELDGKTFATTTTFTAEVYKNLTAITAPNVSWHSTDETVATVSNGVVTAVAEGETEIYYVYEENGDVYESEKVRVKVAFPIVDKTATLSFETDQSNLAYNTVTAKGVFGNEYAGVITKITAKNSETNLWTSDGLDVSSVSVGENTFIVYNSDNYAYEIAVQVYTKIIKTKADLTAFGELYAAAADNTDTNQTKGWYVVLASDIDYENDNYGATGYTTSDRWLGTFDGRGYTISNLQTNFGFLGYVSGGAMLKNTGFINATKSSGYQGGLLCNQLYGSIDNCFVTATNVTINAKRSGGFANTVYNSGKISNSIAIVEFIEGDSYADVVYNAIAAQVANSSSLDNTFAISTSALNSYGSPTVETPQDDYMYRSVEAFKAAHSDLTETTFENYGEFWLMSKGVPMYSGYLTVLESLAITNGETDVKPGESLQMTANFADVTFTLEDTYTGVSITESGLLTVANTAPNGQIVVKVVSMYSDDIYATKTLSIMNLTEETLTTSLGELVLNKDGTAVATDYVISSSGVSGTVTKIQTANTGVEIACTVDGTQITLNNADVQSAVTAQDGGEFAIVIYTTTHKYQAKVNVVSLEISTKAGLDYFATTVYRGASNITSNDRTNGTYGVSVRLTADINYGGAEYPNNGSGTYADHNNYVWQGTFDGCGNVISNIGVRRGFFCIVGTLATVKNLALTGVTSNFNYQFGVICNQVYGSIDNCFVQATLTTIKAGATSATSKNRAGIFNASYNEASITNCIAVVEFETEATNHYIIGRQIEDTVTVENCYGISASETNVVADSMANGYASANGFRSGVETLPDGFNSYWTYTESGLSFGDTQVLTFA